MNGLKLKIPPALLFLLCVVLMWLTDRWLTLEPLVLKTPEWVYGLLISSGGLVVLLGVIEFSKKSTTVNPHKPQDTSAFVKSGIYRLTRNPMYLGMVLILCAAVFKLGNLLTVLFIPCFIWYMNEFQIKSEEEVMEQKFGDEFLDYKKKVRRWV
ncbi:MAG: isoprenylcysteine carboxylmethyltransferase family protein [Gracilimonas sp.]|uniref:methyltransferase family protein n=1 Tax=Gracilimonas TaxID=649462 RepID=UPI001B11304D|nr:isoprenylcysteine carboxylmethyltransferase family protein [Gracilimonas sp.]MBO6584971.1 isoprenylcysteine carboxylmethyltransferase family protein [Gracilimonas sp.]MBO6615758.1 isoprenylcysteine carboxylmethyltransferase family protein [Gracilimonas sp.]